MARQSFETTMAQLERIVEELETGDPPLETAIRKFEEGMRLVRLCSRRLDETEKRVTVLMEKEDGRIEERPLAETGDDATRTSG